MYIGTAVWVVALLLSPLLNRLPLPQPSCQSTWTVKAGFLMITVIAATAGKNLQQSLWSYGDHTSAIIAIIAFHKSGFRWLQRLLNISSSNHSDCSDHMDTSGYLRNCWWKTYRKIMSACKRLWSIGQSLGSHTAAREAAPFSRVLKFYHAWEKTLDYFLILFSCANATCLSVK